MGFRREHLALLYLYWSISISIVSGRWLYNFPFTSLCWSTNAAIGGERMAACRLVDGLFNLHGIDPRDRLVSLTGDLSARCGRDKSGEDTGAVLPNQRYRIIELHYLLIFA